MGGIKKEYRPFSVIDSEARTVIAASVIAFADSGEVDLIVVVIPAQGENDARMALPSRLLTPDAPVPVLFVPGGASRRQSVHNALNALEGKDITYVYIHDGARPWLTGDLITRLSAEVRRVQAVIPVTPLVETPKGIDASGSITKHLRRTTIVSAQTPQVFVFREILTAHERAAEKEATEAIEYTDDAEVWGAFIGPVHTIPGSPSNKKITFPEDLPPQGTLS